MKNKNLLIGVVVLVVVLGSLMWLAKPQPGTQTAAVSVAESNYYDFGMISMETGKVESDFKLTNDSAAPINIRRIYTSCMCTVASLVIADKRFGPFGMAGHGGSTSIEATLLPGAEATIKVVFDPAAHGPAGVGRVERQVTLEDDAGKVLAEYQIAATVTP